MSAKISSPADATLLYPESISRRRLPVNLNQENLGLFSHELEKVIPQTSLIELNNVRVSSDGFLFKGLRVLPESFAFPANLELWKRRALIKFFVNNYFFRSLHQVDGDALWITDEWSYGYFHWLTDVLTRLYVMRDRLDDFVLFLPWEYETREFVIPSLRPFGVRKIEFIRRNETLRCRRLFLPTHTAPSGNYNEEIIVGVRSLLLQAYGDVDYQGEGERVYISRGRAPKRRILNEEAVSKVLAEFGFKTIYSEDHSFAQQVQICSRVRYLVSNHGAGMTNMLFMPEGARVLELRHQTDAVNNCYFTLASALNLNYFYQTCSPESSKQDPHSADLAVDLSAFETNLALLVGS